MTSMHQGQSMLYTTTAGMVAGMVGHMWYRSMAFTEHTPSATTNAVPDLIKAYEAGWNTNDNGARLGALFSDDATYEDIPCRSACRGRREIETYAAEHFVAVTDRALSSLSGFASGNSAVGEWRYSGAYTGTLPGLPPGIGQRISFRTVHMLETDHGSITRARAYYDLHGILVQLGFASDIT